EFSSEKFNYYRIIDKSLCLACKSSYIDEKSIRGRYEAGSYFIKYEQQEIEITVENADNHIIQDSLLETQIMVSNKNYLYQYAIEHEINPKEFSIITEAEKNRFRQSWSIIGLRGITFVCFESITFANLGGITFVGLRGGSIISLGDDDIISLGGSSVISLEGIRFIILESDSIIITAYFFVSKYKKSL
ncbi:12489_t:CDS:2, partial [Cetraspora pellucida]